MAIPARSPNAPPNTWGNESVLNIGSNGEGGMFQGHSGYASIFMWGAFDGATVALRVSPDNKEWFTPAEFAATAKKDLIGKRLPHAYFKWSVTNAGPNTRVSAAVVY